MKGSSNLKRVIVFPAHQSSTSFRTIVDFPVPTAPYSSTLSPRPSLQATVGSNSCSTVSEWLEEVWGLYGDWRSPALSSSFLSIISGSTCMVSGLKRPPNCFSSLGRWLNHRKSFLLWISTGSIMRKKNRRRGLCKKCFKMLCTRGRLFAALICLNIVLGFGCFCSESDTMSLSLNTAVEQRQQFAVIFV